VEEKESLFTRHPKEVQMTYFEHMVFAVELGIILIALSVTCFIHAIFPFLFTHTTSSAIANLHKKLTNRTGKFKDGDGI